MYAELMFLFLFSTAIWKMICVYPNPIVPRMRGKLLAARQNL